jgi:hypothetical protein
MHLSFESLAIIDAPSLHASLMDFHRDTSFRFILEDDSISLASRVHICSCLSKGARLWLVVRSFIPSFRIAQFTFTSALCFCLGLIQPSTFSLLKCDCGHRLDTSNMHLVHCLFKGQRITTHGAI